MVWDVNKKIIRPNKNVIPFAGNASSGQRNVFGTTSESDNLETNLSTEYELGWEFLSDLPPTKQDYNGAQFTNSLLASYIFQQGVVEWSTNQSYFTNSIVSHNGAIYISTTGEDGTPNIGNDPENDTGDWINPEGSKPTVFIYAIGSIQQSILSEEAFKSLNGANWVLWDSNTDITGTDLASIIGIDTLPDASGRVFRNAGGNAAPLGELQDDATALNGLLDVGHTHVSSNLKGTRGYYIAQQSYPDDVPES